MSKGLIGVVVLASMRQDFATLWVPPTTRHLTRAARAVPDPCRDFGLAGRTRQTYCHGMSDHENDGPADKLAEAIEADRGKDAEQEEPDSLGEAISKPDPE